MKRFLPVFKRNSDSNRIIQGNVTECLNAYVIPQTLGTDFGCGESSFIHGVFLPSSELPDHFYHNRKHGPLINQRLRQRYLDDNLTADVPVVSGKWLYAGGLFEHFGHFLAESVHRLWAKSEFDVEGIVFACKPNVREPSALPSYLLEVLKIFDVPVEKIHFVKSLTRFEHLIVPEQGTV